MFSINMLNCVLYYIIFQGKYAFHNSVLHGNNKNFSRLYQHVHYLFMFFIIM